MFTMIGTPNPCSHGSLFGGHLGAGVLEAD